MPEHWLTRLAEDYPSLPRRLRTWVRRSLNEGVGAFLFAIILATAAAISLRIYWLDLQALERAITSEVTGVVATSQEPLDTVRQAGLVSAALWQLNAARDLQSWTCPESDADCRAIDQLHQDVPRIVTALQADRNQAEVNVPTQLQSCLPQGLDWSFLMMPQQLAPANLATAPQEVKEAVRVSKALDISLEHLAKTGAIRRSDLAVQSSGRFVQAYFISPGSILRIWSRRKVDDCKSTFPERRLWAAKQYFDELWRSSTSYTRAYVDYGGNGLVKTFCQAIVNNEPPSEGESNRRLVGALCSDYRLDFAQYRRSLMERLFFQTAHVSIPSDLTTPDSIVVDSRVGIGDRAPADVDAVSKGAVVAWQPKLLADETIRDVLFRQFKDTKNVSTMRRDITSVALDNNHQGFLLPIGGDAGASEHIFFLPRSPRLPWWDGLVGILGLLLCGVASASAVYGRLLARASTESRNRLELLRNLQVGVIQVDSKDNLLGANDRAEEIFGRELPKFADGNTRSSVNFERLIDARVLRVSEHSDGRIELFPSTLQDENEIRRGGEASVYFARLNGTEPPRWIRVSASPMMLVETGATGVEATRLSAVFASVDEVPEVTNVQLRQNAGRFEGVIGAEHKLVEKPNDLASE